MVEGGNAGMTKGGTGDVLAGLVAALYCKNEALVAAQAGSYINKKAGEALAERVGVNFNAGDLVEEVPKQLHRMVEKFGSDS
jgi:NAD(P)H-hydrate epimerase